MVTERLKPGGRRKVYLTEVSEEGQVKVGQKIIIELESVGSHEGLTQIASLDFEDLVGGKSVNGVFRVNRFELV